MPAAGELMVLSRRLIVPGDEHAMQVIPWGRFAFARAEAQWVYCAAGESYNECTAGIL